MNLFTIEAIKRRPGSRFVLTNNNHDSTQSSSPPPPNRSLSISISPFFSSSLSLQPPVLKDSLHLNQGREELKKNIRLRNMCFNS